MPVDKNRIRAFETNNAKNVTTKNVDKVNMELLLTINETTQLLQQNKCKDTVPYILWNDFVNKNGTLAPKSNKNYNRYPWGTKVFVDFGMTNVQTELSYPHPAIILYNLANTAIVVPTTTDDKNSAFSSDIEESIIKVKKDGIIFPNDSIINLHQICSIHKERIISNLKCNVKNFILDTSEIDRLNAYEEYNVFSYGMNLLECIRLKFGMLLNKECINNFFIDNAYMDNEIVDLKKKILSLETEKNHLEEKCKKLQETIDKNNKS